MSKSQVSRLCAGLDGQVSAFRSAPAGGPLSVSLAGRQDRARPRAGRRPPEGACDRLRRARVGPPRGARPRRRRGRDRELLARLPPRPRRPRPRRRAASASPTPTGPALSDREGARRALAALHRALPPRHARPRAKQPAADGRRRDPPGLRRSDPRGGPLDPDRRRRAARAGRAQGRAGCSKTPKPTCSRFSTSRAEHRSKLRSTNPLERVNREIGRRSDVVGIYPNDAALIRLAGSLLVEQNDEWLVMRRYLSQESIDGPVRARSTLRATPRTTIIKIKKSTRWQRSPRPEPPASHPTIPIYTTTRDLTSHLVSIGWSARPRSAPGVHRRPHSRDQPRANLRRLEQAKGAS